MATIWFEYTGMRPTRRVDPYHGIEYGPYREFVACVLGVLPARLRATRKGSVPEVDHLVRLSGLEWKEAQASDEEPRRRGLLRESRWSRAGVQLERSLLTT